MRRIVIIGNGVAGITAARYIRKRSDDEITIISTESEHFFSRTALMYVYMGHMKFEHIKPYEDWFWEKNRILLRRAYVQRVDPDDRQLHLADGQSMPYDILLIASGSRSNKFGWPGQDLEGVQGLYSLQDLELMESNTRGVGAAVIVGGGLIGIEMAEMLKSRGIAVTMLVREATWMSHIFPQEEGLMIGRHILEHHVDLRLSTELDHVVSDTHNHVRAVVTKDGDQIPCGFLGLTVGVSPNVGFLQGSGIECNRGVLVDEYLTTNAPDVYAAGDCVELRQPKPGRQPIEALWYTGRIMGQYVAKSICGDTTPYDPGIWFNSAKFFDIEYQVYGSMPATLPDDEASLYWEHRDGRKSVRINYKKSDNTVIGFNLMGVRYRQEVCEAWIRQRRPLTWVLQNLGAANFDPEFYAQYEAELVHSYNARHPTETLKLKRRRGLRGALESIRAS